MSLWRRQIARLGSFARSKLGRAVGGLALTLQVRPSELLEMDGYSGVERLIWDQRVIAVAIKEWGRK